MSAVTFLSMSMGGLSVSMWAVSSCTLPQHYKRPLLPLSHVSQDKMVSTLAILQASQKKKWNNNTSKDGKGQRGEGKRGVTWHGFTSMRRVLRAVGILGLIIDRWCTNAESFYPQTQDKVTSSSLFAATKLKTLGELKLTRGYLLSLTHYIAPYSLKQTSSVALNQLNFWKMLVSLSRCVLFLKACKLWP